MFKFSFSGIKAQWTAPEDFEGDIQFKYSFVQEYAVYYTNLELPKFRVSRELQTTSEDSSIIFPGQDLESSSVSSSTTTSTSTTTTESTTTTTTTVCSVLLIIAQFCSMLLNIAQHCTLLLILNIQILFLFRQQQPLLKLQNLYP